MKLQKHSKHPHLSVEKAERLLPKIQQIVVELQLLQQAIDLVDSVEVEFDGEQYDDYHEFHELRLLTRLNREFHKLSELFYRKLEQLERHGCILKDIEEGLVDFPHRFEGRDVFLCWKLGEDRIRHWHELDGGYTGRQHIIRQEEEQKDRGQKDREQEILRLKNMRE